MVTGLVDTKRLAEAPFERWIDLASHCPIPVRITDLQASLVYANAAWRKLTNMDQARSIGLGWLDVIQPLQRTEVLGRLLDTDAPTDAAGLAYAMTCGQAVCETLGACHDHQGHKIGQLAFIGKLAATATIASVASSGPKLSNLNDYGLGRYNPTIHAAAALVSDVSLPLMATTAYAQAAQNHIASGRTSDFEQTSRALTHAVQQSVQAVSHLRRLRAVLTPGQTYFELSDLGGLVETVIKDSQPLCQQLGINLEATLVDGPCMASLQASQIYEVLKQLMGHCLERSRSSPQGKVIVTLTRAPDAQWLITIRTEGLSVTAKTPDLNPDETNLAIASARTIIRANDGKLIIEPTRPLTNGGAYKLVFPCLLED